MPRLNYLVEDNFLPATLADALLGYALDQQDQFVPSTIYSPSGDPTLSNATLRHSLTCTTGLGPYKHAFKQHVAVRQELWLAQLGIEIFPAVRTELQLVAYLDGAFFRPHIDTVTRSNRDKEASDRVLTGVYYLHAMPKSFTGGALDLLPIGAGESASIEPAHNRFVAFPSFGLHAVRKVRCPGNNFAAARFAINCWLHRAKRSSAGEH